MTKSTCTAFCMLCNIVLNILSSPEYKVLSVSYCDSAVSDVPRVSYVFRHATCGINFLPCVRSRGHSFSTIIMKLGQNVCLDKISDNFENGSCRIKN